LWDKVDVNKEKWEQAKSLYLAGMEWKAIANDLQLSQATLQTRASREGITKLKAQMQTICTEKKTQSLESLSAIVRSKLAEDAASTIERVNGYDLDGIKDESTREQILGSVAKRSALVFGWSEQGEATSVSINLLGSMPDRFAEVVVSNPV
jgi:transposase